MGNPNDTLAAKSDEELVAEARSAYERAGAAERDASAWKWEVADRVVVLRERGWTLRRIGQEIGVGATTVQSYERVARLYEISDKRPRFVEALAEIKPGTTYEETSDRAARRTLRERPEIVHEAIKADPALAARIIGDDPQVQSRLQGALDKAAAADRRRLPIPDRSPRRDTGEILRTVLGLSVMAKGLLGDAESLAGLPAETKSHVRDVFADVREALDTAEAVMAGEDVQTTIDRILAGVD